jgi:hypothetical protein
MSKVIIVSMKMTESQRDLLKIIAQHDGYTKLSSYIKSKIIPKEEVTLPIEEDFRFIRTERKSFSCDVQVWNNLVKQLGKKKTMSQFIREAIQEKITKDFLELSAN